MFRMRKWPRIIPSGGRMDRRHRQSGLVVLFSLIVFLSVWQIISGPGPPYLFQVEPEPYQPITPLLNATYVYPLDTLNSTDYVRLMDLPDFSFRTLASPCNDTHPFLLVLVHSAPRNFRKRRTIRETWGRRSDSDVKLLFMLGEVDDPALQSELDAENGEHGDFVQGSFVDSYRNVTYKHAMVFKYLVYHCQSAKYLLKTDDDVFVNVPVVVRFLRDEVSPTGALDFILCKSLKDQYAIRSYRSKWRVSYSEYPDKYYPPYCGGWALLYSVDVAFRLYRELQSRPYFWIDDVYITGVILKDLNVVHSNIADYRKSRRYSTTFDNDSYSSEPFLYGKLNLDEEQIRWLWNYTLNGSRRSAG